MMTVHVSPDPTEPVVHLRARGETSDTPPGIGDFRWDLGPGDEMFGLSYEEWRARPGPVEISEAGVAQQRSLPYSPQQDTP